MCSLGGVVKCERGLLRGYGVAEPSITQIHLFLLNLSIAILKICLSILISEILLLFDDLGSCRSRYDQRYEEFLLKYWILFNEILWAYIRHY